MGVVGNQVPVGGCLREAPGPGNFLGLLSRTYWSDRVKWPWFGAHSPGLGVQVISWAPPLTNGQGTHGGWADGA